jgi:Glycosyltransferase
MQAIPLVIKKIPLFRFKIVGDGQYREDLIKLAKSLGVMRFCDFKGRIKSHRVLEDEVAKSCLAIAPYVKKFDKWTYYTDPGKVKAYLACGLPLLLTDIPWNAKEIEENKSGIIISEQPIDIADKIVFLMNDGLINQAYRDNAVRYAQRFNYENIFRELNL